MITKTMSWLLVNIALITVRALVLAIRNRMRRNFLPHHDRVAFCGFGLLTHTLPRLARSGAAGFAVVAFWLALIGSGQGTVAEYSPAWSTKCGMGTEIAKGCAAVRARPIVDATRYPWSAIGRVNVAGLKLRSHCTGVLIGERLVLTAAHCFYIERRRRWVSAPRIHFVAGFQRGTYVGHSTAIRYVVSKTHDITSKDYRHRPHNDWALLDRLTHHCEIIETGNESWRFKNRS